MADLKLEFKTKMQKAYDDFERNMMQGEHFQLQEKLAESIISDIKRNQSFVNSTPALAIYDANANNLKNTGKTFKNICNYLGIIYFVTAAVCVLTNGFQNLVCEDTNEGVP